MEPAGRPLKLAVITGSTREGRFGARVARWFNRAAEAHPRFTVDAIDLLEADLPDRLTKEPAPATVAYRARLHDAEAMVLITPEYNHSYPASLKQAIDLAMPEWGTKPVAFVSYGGMSGGLRAVEALRPVLSEVHAITTRDVVSLHRPRQAFDDQDRLPD
ncbi:MAG: NAD(P)H-dependent oxidoreductase, partial [Miltoncostaeaceae bacterium]